MSTQAAPSGPLGQPRGIGFGILLFIITLGIYGLYWVYKTQEEMKQHTGDGLGGVLGLVVWILISPVSAFVIPSEVGNMYKRAGKEPPVSGWTGPLALPVRVPDRHGDRLVREDPGLAQPLLGRGGRIGSRRRAPTPAPA